MCSICSLAALVLQLEVVMSKCLVMLWQSDSEIYPVILFEHLGHLKWLECATTHHLNVNFFESSNLCTVTHLSVLFAFLMGSSGFLLAMVAVANGQWIPKDVSLPTASYSMAMALYNQSIYLLYVFSVHVQIEINISNTVCGAASAAFLQRLF